MFQSFVQTVAEIQAGRGDQTKAGRRVRQQHVKRNTTKYENRRRSQQAAETAPIKQQGERHIRTKIVEHGAGGENSRERTHEIYEN